VNPGRIHKSAVKIPIPEQKSRYRGNQLVKPLKDGFMIHESLDRAAKIAARPV